MGELTVLRCGPVGADEAVEDADKEKEAEGDEERPLHVLVARCVPTGVSSIRSFSQWENQGERLSGVHDWKGRHNDCDLEGHLSHSNICIWERAISMTEISKEREDMRYVGPKMQWTRFRRL